MCPSCKDKRKSYCIKCRVKEYHRARSKYSQSQQKILERYRNIILKGIEAATRYDKLDGLESFEQIKEAFSIELVLKWTEEILHKGPDEKKIFLLAKRYTFRRKASWYNLLIKQREAIQAASEQHILECDSEGNIADFGPAPIHYLPLHGLPLI